MRTLSSPLGNESLLRATPALARPLILVADDDEDTRVMFRTMLQLRGYRVIEAPDGEKTVQMAESALPDLILMDINLPGVDGFDATRRIRESCRMPIVFVSGHGEARFLAQARQAGCDEYLVKPIDLDQLERIIKKYTAQKPRSANAL
jgi:twitching motility two-component system response regulator PilH